MGKSSVIPGRCIFGSGEVCLGEAERGVLRALDGCVGWVGEGL